MKLAYYPVFLSILISFSAAAQTDNVGSGRALKFDGVDDYIDLGNIYDDLTLPITVSAWVNIDPNKPSSNPIFTSQDNAEIYNGFWLFVSPTTILMEIGDGRGSNNPMFRQGKQANINIPAGWNHICGVMRSPTDADLYLNGIRMATHDSGVSIFPMDSNFPADVAQIGHHLSNGINYWFSGMLDDVRVYNLALTQAQVRETMCKKLTGNEGGLIGYWDFNEISGHTVFDKSPNGFNGTLQNSTARQFSGAPLGDESVFLYTTNWSTAQLTMSEGLHQLAVTDVTASPAGAHIYTVRTMPSQTSGINTAIASPPYFGVFIASVIRGHTFDLEYPAACELVFREDNSESTWAAGPFINLIDRTECIKVGDPYEAMNADLGRDEILCPFDNRTLNPIDNPVGYTFVWQDGSTETTFTAADYGTYWVTVSKGCSFDRDTITFTQAPNNLSIDLGEDQTICPLTSRLQPLNNPAGYTFTWSDGSAESSLLVEAYGKYWVTVENECGTASDTIQFIRPDYEGLTIPNIITPNNDNLNDFFEVHDDLTGSTLEIFNRWGKKVYHTNNYQNNWSAESLPSGVYYYVIRHICLEDKKGWLSVSR